MKNKNINSEQMLNDTVLEERTEGVSEEIASEEGIPAADDNPTDAAVSDKATSDEPKEERVVIFEEALEAILFAAGHPISYATLARVFDMTPGKVKDKIFEYSLKYNDPSIPRGVILLTYGDSCQLCTKKYYLNEIRDALGIKKSGTISTSSMEALAIVAYNQPVTRIFVDTLRRADSSYAMNNLIDRGLIEAQGRLDAPGRPMLYGTTPDFLRVFGLKDLSQLPTTSEEITDLFAKGRNAEDTEGAVQEEMDFSASVIEEKSDGERTITEAEAEGSVTDFYEDEESADDMAHNALFDEGTVSEVKATYSDEAVLYEDDYEDEESADDMAHSTAFDD